MFSERKTNIRKRWRILAVVSLVLAVPLLTLSCSKKEDAAAENAGAEKTLKGSITFSTWGSADEKAVNEEIIKAFEAKNPGTKVNLEYIPADYIAKIDTMFLGGNAPDVIYGHPHYFTGWASQGLVKDLSAEFEADREFYSNPKFAQNMYGSFQYKNAPVATINGHDTYLLYYNKNLFDAAGVSYPDDTWTWDTWLEAAKKLSNDKEGNEKRYATAFTTNPQDLFPFIYSFGGNIFDSMENPAKVVFNSPRTVEALTFIQDAVWVHKVAPSYVSEGVNFDSGTIAMDVAGSWSPVGRRHITEFKWDMANLPFHQGRERRTGALFAGYAVNAFSKNPDLAYAFARFFQEDEGQMILSGLGLITVINQEIASLPENLNGPGFPEHHGLRVSSISYATNGYANLTNWQEMMEKGINPHIENLISNNITPGECARLIQADLERLFAESN
ncbi:MAG: sugar ABC transporter substrate-binding protein [Treponema sp.]|jgi:multiple sugar transport system substrate-binding protein|nr:sugar ABC transporter substrate-binding protein [Treponema sp.]